MTKQEDCSFVRDCELTVVQKSTYTSGTPTMARIKNLIVEQIQILIIININKEEWDVKGGEKEMK